MSARLHVTALTLTASTLLVDPALAQEPPSSADLLASFAARCAEISADPRAAVNALVGLDGGAGGMTSDGTMAQITEPLAQIGPDLNGILFFNQVIVEGEARQVCTISVFAGSSAEAPTFADMADVASAEAETILDGPAIQTGGPVLSGALTDAAGLAQLLVWHRKGSGADGPILTLIQDSRTLSLSLGRVVPVTE